MLSYLLITITLISLVIFSLYIFKQGNLLSDKKWAIPVYIALILLLRVFISPIIEGHPTDIGCFKGWADYAASKGLSNFYLGGIFADYPPGYIYVLYLIGKLAKLFSFDYNSQALLILIKLPAIIADVITTYIIFKYGRKKLSDKAAYFLSLIYALNPVIIFNSSIWGQVDSVFALFILLTVIKTAEDKLEIASVIFTIAFLIKPQAFIFTPILLLAFINKRSIKTFFKSAISAILVFIVLLIPFSIKQSPFWIFSLYIKTLSSYPYATINAPNLFGLFKGNWVPDANRFLIFSYSTWGFIFIISIVVFATLMYFKSSHESRYFFISTFIIIAVFILTAKMHERYMFPGLILLIMTYIYTKDKRYIYLYGGFSLTQLISLVQVLITALNKVFIDKGDALFIFISLVNVILFVVLVKIAYDMYYKNKAKNIEIRKAELKGERISMNNKDEKKNKTKNIQSLPHDKLEKFTFTKIDFICLVALTLVYAVIALFNLGAFKEPQTTWVTNNPGSSFYVDFGKSTQLDKIYYYAGLGEPSQFYVNLKFDVQLSEDNLNWEKVKSYKLDNGYIWNWHNSDIKDKGRYAKITINSPNIMLNELVFSTVVNNKEENVNVSKIYLDKSSKLNINDVKKLFDEQNTVSYKPLAYDGMYFDEVYHARTAYEQINHMTSAEWTHPPLGKIIIGLGVRIFGMTPFGWRVMGTLFGIAMLPFMYLLGKRLFGSTKLAFITSFLMACDFMHLTQTRIATIDVYGVFFIIVMYYYMLKYFNTSFYKEKLSKTIIILGLCGLAFGLGAASKWICLYAAIGLAIIFFTTVYSRTKEYFEAKRILSKPNKSQSLEECKHIADIFPNYLTKTILWCVLFFIVVPLIIYYLSYIPVLKVPGKSFGVKQVVEEQKRMYNYHKNVTSVDQPAVSPWWEWPIMKTPKWYYYNNDTTPAGKASGIVAMGNPAVWWIGIITMAATFIIGIKRKDRTAYFIAIGYLSQYLPWIIAPRKLTYIYHYFASVPFIILSIVYVIKYLEKKFKWAKYLSYAYLGIALLLFILFYPILTGYVTNTSYLYDFLNKIVKMVFIHF